MLRINKVFGITAIALFVLLVQGCAVSVGTDNFVYQDEQRTPLELSQIQQVLIDESVTADLESLTVSAKDGTELSGIKMMLAEAQANVVLYGGNGMTIAKAHKILRHFAQVPVNVVWFDYRGTGSSAGRGELSLEQLKQDGLITFQQASQALPSGLPILVHGLSMGSLLGSYVANNTMVSGLVLDGAITSVPDLVEHISPSLVTVELSEELAAIDNHQQLKEYDGPLLLLAGEEDETTPPIFAERLYQQASSRNKEFVLVPAMAHGVTMKSKQAKSAYQQFLSRI